MGALFAIMLYSVASGALIAAVNVYESNPDELNRVISAYVPYLIVVKFLYHAIFVYFYGGSLGKLALNLRVCPAQNLSNEKITFGVSMLRSGARLFSEMTFYIGFLLAFFTKSRQSLQDLVAKTLVVEIEKK